jgi:hypothetical protein
MARFLITMLPANDLGLPTRMVPIAGRDDNSSWKLYLAFPNEIVIPTGA